MTSGRLPKIPRCLTWASCCSGSEGPVFCMQAINSAAKAFPGLSPFCFTHVFSCEKDGEKRKWIANASALAAETVQSLTGGTAQQQKCQGCCHSGSASHAAASPCLFVDICELGGDVADCAQKCPVPQVDLLVLGTSCKDMSRANPCQHKDSAVLSQQVSRGGSAQTFQGMLYYLQSKCPPLVLFENVDAMDDSKGTDMNNMDIFLAETSARGYESQVCMTDAAEFGCSARRRRIYVEPASGLYYQAFDSCFCHLPGFAAWLPSRRALCDPDPFPGKFGTSSTGTRVALRQAGETKREGR